MTVGTRDLLLEAEVAKNQQPAFEKRYKKASGDVVSPGNPQYYQDQPNKWGSELRVYFNDPGMAAALIAAGIAVEDRKTGYKSGEYAYRFNNNKVWWKLVERLSMRLGHN